MNTNPRRPLMAAVGLLTAGLVLGGVPAAHAAPGDKHLPGRSGIAKIFPQLADGEIDRHRIDELAFFESKCDAYGTGVPVKWATRQSLSSDRSQYSVRIDVAKMRNKKRAKRVVRSYARLSTCKKTTVDGDRYRIRPLRLPKVGQARAGMTIRVTYPGGVDRLAILGVRNGKKVAFVVVGGLDKKVPKKRLRKLTKLVARKL